MLVIIRIKPRIGTRSFDVNRIDPSKSIFSQTDIGAMHVFMVILASINVGFSLQPLNLLEHLKTKCVSNERTNMENKRTRSGLSLKS